VVNPRKDMVMDSVGIVDEQGERNIQINVKPRYCHRTRNERSQDVLSLSSRCPGFITALHC